MADLREMLLQEQNRLEKILQKTSEQLKDAPPGKLRLSSSNKCVQYYYCVPGGRKNGQYLPREKEKLAYRLAQKSYDERVVKLADKIAYINHDIEDAVRAGVMKESDIPEDILSVLGRSKSDRINTLVISVIENSGRDITLDMDTEMAFEKLHSFMFANVYTNPVCKSEESKAMDMIKRLYEYFTEHPETLPGEYAGIRDNEGAERAACDYIAGMTDHYAVKTYTNLFVPNSWTML